VADATRLERNLNLVLQILEITDRAVLCLNLIDEARRHGISIDTRILAKELGVPVIPAAARQNEGMTELLAEIEAVASGQTVCQPRRAQNEPPALKRALKTLMKKLEHEFPGLSNARWVALRLLEGDPLIVEAVRSGELRDLGKSPAISNPVRE
ncbi:MAG: iron transporter FeoB, partial [Calditrichaeota bacterium]|nr:iron transporter FeoB [Calditrichota bacterium]